METLFERGFSFWPGTPPVPQADDTLCSERSLPVWSRWNDVCVSALGGEHQELDDINWPPEEDPEPGPIQAWLAPGHGMYYHCMQSVQLKTIGHTHKAVCMKFYGSDPLTPSKARFDVRRHRRTQAVRPPSTFHVVPVINPASGLTR